jgi:F-type H+-transporting ATPase subunit delta
MAVVMSGASRESLARAGELLDERVDRASSADLGRLGEELYAVMGLLGEQPTLRRYLADPTAPPEVRAELADRVLSDKVGRQSRELVSELVRQRWSRSGDLVEVLEVLARRALLGVAEKDGSLESVEDELFRFGRLLEREPRLRGMLGDTTTPADKRIGLLDELIEGKVSPVTRTLLAQTVRYPRGRSLDLAAEELSELAAGRRDRYVAHVSAPAPLSRDQERRLAETLTRIYRRPMSLQVEVDPDLLGGLMVRVGNEVIDGSVAGRLATARRQLPK